MSYCWCSVWAWCAPPWLDRTPLFDCLQTDVAASRRAALHQQAAFLSKCARSPPLSSCLRLTHTHTRTADAPLRFLDTQVSGKVASHPQRYVNCLWNTPTDERCMFFLLVATAGFLSGMLWSDRWVFCLILIPALFFFLAPLRTDMTFAVKSLRVSRFSFTLFLLRNIVPASYTQKQNIYFLRSVGAQGEEKCLEEIGAWDSINLLDNQSS